MTRAAAGTLAHPEGAPERLTVIFKGSNRCNARCVFCSVGEPGARMIAWDDFERLAEQLEQLVQRRGIKHLRFTFHGGEPTLLGARFIDRACRRIREIGVAHSFNLQSNLLWNDERLLETLRRHQIQLGTSFDPISGDRRTPAGTDAFPAWLANYLVIARSGQAPGAIFVVTRRALGAARRLYCVAEALSEAAAQPFALQVNPVYPQGRATDDPGQLVTVQEFGEFLVELYELWEAAGRNLVLSPIRQLAEQFPEPRGRPASCAFGPDCSRTHLGIDFDLNVAGCGRRLDSRAFLGNLRDRPLVAILENSEEHARIAERAEGLRAGECSGCPYYELCYGGCPDDVWLNTGDVRGRSGWCESYRLLFDTLASRLRQPRPVRRRVPRKQLWPAARVTVQPVVEGGSVVSAPGDGFIETWLLPTEDGRAFRFDSGLDRPKGRRPPRIRLLVHNRQVKALVLWEDLLRARGVSVVLFESEDLEPSLGLLNSLGAVVELDVIRILEGPTGQAALCRIVECFVTDPQWKAQILPFSNVLANAMHERHSPFLTRWGLRPGNFEVAGERNTADAAAALILGEVVEESRQSLAGWLADRRPCLECDHRRICGGCLAAGDGKPCHPIAHQSVTRLGQVAVQVREAWRRANAGSGRTAP